MVMTLATNSINSIIEIVLSAMNVRLPKIERRKDFMDYLEGIIHPPKYEDEYSSKGRLRELKTYILESEVGFPPSITTDEISCKVIDTGLEDIKILQASIKNNSMHEFFLDVSDKRFCVLHTSDKSEDTNKIIDELTKDCHHTFDHTWFYYNMLKRLADKSGNSFKGFGVAYSDKFLRTAEDEDSDIDDFSLNISGSLTKEMQQLIATEPKIERITAYNKVRIRRGSSLSNYVQDDIHNDGYFAVKQGKSVQDHLQLVDICKDEYSETINSVENLRIGVKEIENRTLVEGKPFDFIFPNKIENLDLFIEKMFNSAIPFKLWGLKSKIYDGYFRILAIDLHTGNPIDFEIANDMMRVYLSKGNCGNTILRLFTNLQIHYDSKTACSQLN